MNTMDDNNVHCPIYHEVSTVAFNPSKNKPHIFKLSCIGCKKSFYKCELCYNFQRSSPTEAAPPMNNNSKKIKTASCFSTIITQENTKKKNNFCFKHDNTHYHKAVFYHVSSRNPCLLQSTNTNVSYASSTNINECTPDHDKGDSFISCGIPDD